MELLSYLRFRWKSLTVLFVLGLLAIAALASGRVTTSGVSSGLPGSTDYTAQVQVLVRPPTSQLTVFGFNLDRYVETEAVTMKSDAGLESEAKGTSLSPAQLDDALTTTHVAGSDVVTLSVQTDDPDESVDIANHVAKVYLEDSRARSLESGQLSTTYLQKQVEQEKASLQQANAELARAFRRLVNSNDTIGAVDPSLLSPTAYAQQQVALSNIQQAQQQILQLGAEAQDPSLSRVLTAATTASRSAEPWRPTTIGAAVIGLLLALVALAAVGLSFSRRVISLQRWQDATTGSTLRQAIHGRPGRQRSADLRRIVNAIANAGLSAPVSVVAYPDTSRKQARTVRQLVSSLESAGVPCHSEDQVPSSAARHAADVPAGVVADGPVVVVVELTTCRIEDATMLADGDPYELARTVPVLI